MWLIDRHCIAWSSLEEVRPSPSGLKVLVTMHNKCPRSRLGGKAWILEACDLNLLDDNKAT